MEQPRERERATGLLAQGHRLDTKEEGRWDAWARLSISSITQTRKGRCEKYCDLWVSMLSAIFAWNLLCLSTCLLNWLGACSLPWGISILSPLFVFFILLVILSTLPLNYPKSPLARTLPAQHTYTHRISSNQFLIRTSTRVSLLIPNLAFHFSYWSLPVYVPCGVLVLTRCGLEDNPSYTVPVIPCEL